uniref:Formin-like protein n=3 Tax=Manihot esculenta TaxID=3983 RepID=A0A2C9UK09_MANES
MALFRRFFYRKPPDRLLEISERVYVFDCCFSTDVMEEDEYKVYLGGIVAQLQDYYADASFMVFNFREGERRSQISDILSQYDMTVMDYPRQYEGCPMLSLEMIHHFLRSSGSWLSVEGQQNVLLMHCERGGWPVLAFMLAGLLLYRKQYSGEQKTLEMIYKQAPKELLHLLSPLNPQPSQLRYLQYISRQSFGSDWPPSDTPLVLDCLMLRALPLFEGGKGCRPVVRVYGQDPSKPANRTSKLLFSTSKTKKNVRHYLQEECMLVKIDVRYRVQGDVVLECVHLEEDLVHEEMIFRVMFHTAFIRANILMLCRDEIDTMWDTKEQFPKDFKAEVHFGDGHAVMPNLEAVIANEDGNEAETTSPEEFFEAEEIFSNVVDAQEAKGDYDAHTDYNNSTVEIEHKEVFRDTFADGNLKEDGKLDFNVDAVKDIAVDDVKYKMHEKVYPDIQAVKDIAVDDGDKKVDTMIVAVNTQSNRAIKEMDEDVSGDFKAMEDRANGENNTTKVVQATIPHLKLSVDVGSQKPEKIVPPSPRNTKPVVTDTTVVKQKTKQLEPHGTNGKQTRPNTVPRWVTPNKAPFANSMHVAHPPSRYNSAPPALAFCGKGAIADTRGLASGRGRGFSRSSAGAAPRRSSLKPLHWSKVTRALQGSLWEELQRHGEPQMYCNFLIFFISNICFDLYTVPDIKNYGIYLSGLFFIDLRRANNTEIMLTKVKMPLPDMMAAVLAMDESTLDADQVENLIKFCPTKEEMELLKGYTGDKENLGKCEQYFLELMKVPRVESKLRVFSFKIQFGSQITEFKKSLNTVNSACGEVRNSLKLKEIMKKILYLGNTLNQGTARGSAIGFKLDSLLKLTDTRASNSKMTLMHYLCKVLAAKSPALLDFHLDLVSLEAASKIQLKSLAEEMQAIIKGLEKVKQELVASENDGPVSEIFRKTLKEFISVAETEVASVTNLYSVVGRNADALALYFGEDPARCPFEQVTATLLNFVRLFRKAHEENLKQAELEKKKAAKEAEMEKAKGTNLTKKSVN